MILSGTRPANHHRLPAAGDCADQPRNRVFERHTIRAARAAAREPAWALAGDTAPGADGNLVTVDLDATIVIAHSEKEEATPTWKKTVGFHPMTAFADHGAGGNGEPLAIVPRAESAGSNTAAAISRRRGWRWRSCLAGCAAGSWSAPTPAAARTGSRPDPRELER
jgi:DDE family transposase